MKIATGSSGTRTTTLAEKKARFNTFKIITGIRTRFRRYYSNSNAHEAKEWVTGWRRAGYQRASLLSFFPARARGQARTQLS